MKKKRVLFISSTGGHLDELMQLKPMFEKYNYYIVTEKTQITIKQIMRITQPKVENKKKPLLFGTT